MSKTETLSIDLLRLDGDTQSRTEVHEDTVAEYADIITAAGSQWPFGPIDVFHDGSSYFVADGFHRTLAANKSGRASVPCIVKKGTAREARIAGMLANNEHGLRPSRADRRLNVNWLLDTFPTMVQAEISKNTGVCIRTVKLIVAERKPAKVHNAPSDASKPKPETAAGSGSKPVSRTAQEPDESPDDSPAPNTDDVPFDAPEPSNDSEKPNSSPAEQAKKIRNMLQQHIDKAVRLADDLHDVKANHATRVKVVKLLQEAGGLLW